MILTQTSIVHKGRLATFQLQEMPEKSSPEWRNFRVLRLDWIEEPWGKRRRIWSFGWNGERFSHKGELTDLKKRFPKIREWLE